MPIRYLKNKNVLILYPSGRFDLEQSRHIDQELQNLASTESSSNFLLNMEGVDYVNSYGLKVIVNTYRNFKNEGRLFALCNLSNATRKVFDLIGHFEMFEMFTTEKEGVDYLNNIENNSSLNTQ